MTDRETIVELAKRVDECVVALTNELAPTIRLGAGQPVPMAIAKLQAFIGDIDPVMLESETRSGSTVTVVDEKHDHDNWCRKHDCRMAGVRATGQWVCEAFYEDESVHEGECVLELRPPDPRRPELRDGTLADPDDVTPGGSP